ncbi:hypothetical protein AGMMS49975_28150 [Clostridia bacterium]|nr:hypothetical protein AGMMS49975_28150 [Clostridia bacterium]
MKFKRFVSVLLAIALSMGLLPTSVSPIFASLISENSQYPAIFRDILNSHQDEIILAEDSVYIVKTVSLTDIDGDGVSELIFLTAYQNEEYNSFGFKIYSSSGKQIELAYNRWGIDHFSFFTTKDGTLCFLDLQSTTGGGDFTLLCKEYKFADNSLNLINETLHKVDVTDESEYFSLNGQSITKHKYQEITKSYVNNVSSFLLDGGIELTGAWVQEGLSPYAEGLDDFTDTMWLALYSKNQNALSYQEAINMLGNDKTANDGIDLTNVEIETVKRAVTRLGIANSDVLPNKINVKETGRIFWISIMQSLQDVPSAFDYAPIKYEYAPSEYDDLRGDSIVPQKYVTDVLSSLFGKDYSADIFANANPRDLFPLRINGDEYSFYDSSDDFFCNETVFTKLEKNGSDYALYFDHYVKDFDHDGDRGIYLEEPTKGVAVFYRNPESLIGFTFKQYTSRSQNIIAGISVDESSSWATEAINLANAKGIIPNSLKNKYQQNITRQEFCGLVVSLYNKLTGNTLPIGNPDEFTDINATMPYYKEILQMSGLGIVSGVGDNNFNPDGEL